MARVADIPAPKMPEDDEHLARLGREAGHGTATARKGSGGWCEAQRDLTRMADAILKGQSPDLRGRYSLADKYADRPTFSHRPYRTSARYASGRAGRRSVGRPW